jgi:putative iron-sulfur cluster-binding protein
LGHNCTGGSAPLWTSGALFASSAEKSTAFVENFTAFGRNVGTFSRKFPSKSTAMSDYLLSPAYVKAEAQRLGFVACGLSPAEPMDAAHVARRERWLAEGCHGEMSYLARNEEKRRDPRLLVEGVRTIVSVALNYHTPDPLGADGRPRRLSIARYARGQDYHEVMKSRLFALLNTLRAHYESVGGVDAEAVFSTARAFTDTAPVDERYWAWRSGLGWIGKNTQLIISGAGSRFFLGELFLPFAAETYDHPVESQCGTCDRCLRVCPTQALSRELGLDARKCLSYLSIEYRGETLPEGTGRKLGHMFYGCDRCTDCCPWNRLSVPTDVAEFYPSAALADMSRDDWRGLTVEQYRTLFKGSAVKRAKYEGLMRNIRAAFPPSSAEETKSESER